MVSHGGHDVSLSRQTGIPVDNVKKMVSTRLGLYKVDFDPLGSVHNFMERYSEPLWISYVSAKLCPFVSEALVF